MNYSDLTDALQENMPFMGFGYGKLIHQIYCASPDGFGIRLAAVIAVMAVVVLSGKCLIPWLTAKYLAGWMLKGCILLCNSALNQAGLRLCQATFIPKKRRNEPPVRRRR